MQFKAHTTLVEEIDGLFIRPELFGRSHIISTRAGTATITLPNEIGAGRLEQRETLVAFDGHPDHTWYGVGRVDMRIDLNTDLEFEGDESDFNSMEVLRSGNAKPAFELVESVGLETWDLWKRTLRWTTLAPEIALSDIRTAYDATRKRGFKIFRTDDGALFRGHGGSITYTGGGKATAEAWDMAQAAFSAEEAPPVWIDFLMEARRREHVGDYRGAIVNGAIAAETAVRARLGEVRPALFARVIDRTPISESLGRWEALVGWTTDRADAEGRSGLLDVLSVRNKLLHEGLSDPVKISTAAYALPALSRFVLACDAEIADAQGRVKRSAPVDGALGGYGDTVRNCLGC